MAAQLVPEWLATHERSPTELDFLALEEATCSSLLAVFVGAVERPRYEEIDRCAVQVWHEIRAQFPEWRGQRINLGELWFFAPLVEHAREALAPIMRRRSPHCDVRATAIRLPEGAGTRLRTINDVGTAVIRDLGPVDQTEFWRLVDGASPAGVLGRRD